MKINEKQFNSAVRVVTTDTFKKILFMMYEDVPLTYTDIKRNLGMDKNRMSAARYAYYIMTLRRRNLIKREGKHYFLTRIGLQVTKLIFDLQKICTEYDLSDCDADGKIEVVVKRK